MTVPADTSHTYALDLPGEAYTQALAQALAPWLQTRHAGDAAPQSSVCIHLRGELGAGKTSFVRALLRACGVQGRIKSPSYALLESYKVSNIYFYHLDFYRFGESGEWRDAGFVELFQEQAVILIEWPEQAGDTLPVPDMDVHLAYTACGRRATLTAHSPQGIAWLNTLPPRPG